MADNVRLPVIDRRIPIRAPFFLQCCWEDIRVPINFPIPGHALRRRRYRKMAEPVGPRFGNVFEAVGFAQGLMHLKEVVNGIEPEGECGNSIMSAQSAKSVSVNIYRQGPDRGNIVEWFRCIWNSRTGLSNIVG